MSDLYIGLMSGTSMDGLDAVLVRFDGDKPELLVKRPGVRRCIERQAGYPRLWASCLSASIIRVAMPLPEAAGKVKIASRQWVSRSR